MKSRTIAAVMVALMVGGVFLTCRPIVHDHGQKPIKHLPVRSGTANPVVALQTVQLVCPGVNGLTQINAGQIVFSTDPCYPVASASPLFQTVTNGPGPGFPAASSFVGGALCNGGDAGCYPFNVRDPPYGAAGDGAADDTGPIQSALTAAIAAGGSVLFPCGTYKTTSTLNVANASHVTILGTDRGCVTIRAATPTFDILTISGTSNYLTVRNITFKGSSVAHESVWGVLIPSSATVDHLTFDHNRFTGTNDGLLMEFATDSSATDNTFDGLVNDTGIDGNGYGIGPGLARNYIAGNHFTGPTRHDIYAGGGIHDTVITGNFTFQGGCNCSTPTCESIAVFSTDTEPPSTRDVISNNIIVQPCFTGIGVNVNVTDVQITNNVVLGAGGRASSTAGSIVLNGSCLPNNLAADAGGVENPERTVITGNSVTGYFGGAGIVVSCAGGSVISGNQVSSDLVQDGGGSEEGVRVLFNDGADGGGGNYVGENIIGGLAVVVHVNIADNGGGLPFPVNTQIGRNWSPQGSIIVSDNGHGTTTHVLTSQGSQWVDGGVKITNVAFGGGVLPEILGPPGFNLQIQSNTGEPVQVLTNNGTSASTWDTAGNQIEFGWFGVSGLASEPNSDSNIGCYTPNQNNCSVGSPANTDFVVNTNGGHEAARFSKTDQGAFFDAYVTTPGKVQTNIFTANSALNKGVITIGDAGTATIPTIDGGTGICTCSHDNFSQAAHPWSCSVAANTMTATGTWLDTLDYTCQ